MTITAYKFKSFKILSPKKMEEEKIDIVPDRTEWKKNAYNTRNEKITTNIQKNEKKTQHEIRRERKYKKEKIEQKKKIYTRTKCTFRIDKGKHRSTNTLLLPSHTLLGIFFLRTLFMYTACVYENHIFTHKTDDDNILMNSMKWLYL